MNIFKKLYKKIRLKMKVGKLKKIYRLIELFESYDFEIKQDNENTIDILLPEKYRSKDSYLIKDKKLFDKFCIIYQGKINNVNNNEYDIKTYRDVVLSTYLEDKGVRNIDPYILLYDNVYTMWDIEDENTFPKLEKYIETSLKLFDKIISLNKDMKIEAL
jgi:hypothetical protein